MVVGAASRDVAPADARGWRLGGGVTYSALAVARLGLRVGALIGVDGPAAEAHELGVLRRAGVDVRLVRLDRGPVFDNREEPSGRVQLAHSASDALPPSALPDDWRTPGCLLLNPVGGELGVEWRDAAPAGALVALGWQGLFRRLVAGRPVVALPLAPGPLLERADIATVSTEDAAGGAAAPLDRLLPRVGQQLVVTSDRCMSLHLQRAPAGWRARSVPIRPAAARVDPTGAGDVFLASWTAGLLAARAGGRADEPWRALALATAAAGAKVEVATLAEMADLSELCRRLVRPPDAAGQSAS